MFDQSKSCFYFFLFWINFEDELQTRSNNELLLKWPSSLLKLPDFHLGGQHDIEARVIYNFIHQRIARKLFHGPSIGRPGRQARFRIGHIFTFNFMLKAIQLLCLGILIQFITFYLLAII